MHKSTCILIITTLYMYEGGSDKPYVVLRLCFCGVGGGVKNGGNKHTFPAAESNANCFIVVKITCLYSR